MTRPVTDAAEADILDYLKQAKGPRKTCEVLDNTKISRNTFRRVVERLHTTGQVVRLGDHHYQWVHRLHAAKAGKVATPLPVKRDPPICNGTMQTTGWTPPRMVCARSEAAL